MLALRFCQKTRDLSFQSGYTRLIYLNRLRGIYLEIVAKLLQLGSFQVCHLDRT